MRKNDGKNSAKVHLACERLKGRLAGMSLFWKSCLLTAGLLMVVVALAEGTVEPAAEALLESLYGGFQPWQEVVVWMMVILTASLACGYILSKILTRKLNSLVQASKALAQGNLAVRLPVKNNDKDAFDVLGRSFNDMAQAIEDQLRHERRLLADISHELRSPLTRMGIAVELLERRRAEEERAAIVQRLGIEVERMGELVSTLLAQGRERFEGNGEAGPVDLSRLLSELAADFAFQGGAQGKNVRHRIAAGLVVQGQTGLLRRLFGNILSNAVFYTPHNGEVLLEAGGEGGDLRISVRDFGPGVPEAQLEDIFRAFYRVDGSRSRQSGGVGLGLAIAREAAFRHGGRITARNALPGLEIIITLPCTPRCGI